MRRRLRLAAPFIVLMLIVAGCGGSKVAVQEVPGDPVQLTVPGQRRGARPAGHRHGDHRERATPTPTRHHHRHLRLDGHDPARRRPPAPGTTGGGTRRRRPAPTGARTTSRRPPAPPRQQFEDFCAQNPGAC